MHGFAGIRYSLIIDQCPAAKGCAEHKLASGMVSSCNVFIARGHREPWVVDFAANLNKLYIPSLSFIVNIYISPGGILFYTSLFTTVL